MKRGEHPARARAMALLVLATAIGPALGAQERRLPLRPAAGEGRSVVPFMDGWYENDDGSAMISFGYFNLNQDSVVEIQLGEANRIEPERFDGMQPAVFFPGRHHGAFGVTVPAEMRNQDVRWYLTSGNGETAQVPGRARASAYQLDRNPRPHGSLPPLVWFTEDENRQGRDPAGVVAERMWTVSVGEPLTLEVHVQDPSVRDMADRRIREGVPVHVVWLEHQGPGAVTYTRHASTPEPDSTETDPEGTLPQVIPFPPGPHQITLPEGRGTARVAATFSKPGDYIVRARADNFGAPDSNPLDQCCWSNAYVRVRVTE